MKPEPSLNAETLRLQNQAVENTRRSLAESERLKQTGTGNEAMDQRLRTMIDRMNEKRVSDLRRSLQTGSQTDRPR